MLSFSIFPTIKCGHNCDYCLISKEKVLPKENISLQEVLSRLKIILEIIQKDFCQSPIEFLLGDDDINFNEDILNEIKEFSKKKPISIVMNNKDVMFNSIPTVKHILSIDELENDISPDLKVFVVTTENINSLTNELVLKHLFNTVFLIDTSIQDEKSLKFIKQKLKCGVFRSICLNTDNQYDLFADSGLITFSCSKKITHIIGYVDFENKKFVINKTYCDKKCKLI
jgi:hypothetical protein